MATFKAGDRVKRVKKFSSSSFGEIGWTATVVTPWESNPEAQGMAVLYDNGTLVRGCEPQHFAPLTDPLAEQFIERIKKLEPLREPQTV